jgi:hypothetical protein
MTTPIVTKPAVLSSRPLICGIRELHRRRICGLPPGHTGPHSWVPKTIRED